MKKLIAKVMVFGETRKCFGVKFAFFNKKTSFCPQKPPSNGHFREFCPSSEIEYFKNNFCMMEQNEMKPFRISRCGWR